MFHIMKYHFTSLIRNKTMLFWTLLFPIALSTFMSMTALHAYDSLKLEIIPIGIVASEEYKQDQVLQEVIKQVSEGEHAIFSVTLMSEEEATTALKEKTIDGFITYEDRQLRANVQQSDINETVFVSFLNEYIQKSELVKELMIDGANSEQVMALFKQTQSYMIEQETHNSDMASVYFYGVMAMTMLYGGYWSLRTNHEQQSDHTELGKRNSVAPTSRAVQMLADFIISICLHLIVQVIMLCYMINVLGVDFGNQMTGIFITIVIGSFAGNALGMVVSAYGPKRFDSSTTLLTGITLVGCAMSGMMMAELKYYIDMYIPILSKLNPANMITDALYAQYYYGISDRFFTNIASLILFTVIAYMIAYLRLRRKQYASL